jgi:hypothetical protein
MDYGQSSKDLEEELEEENEKIEPRKNYRNSLLPRFRFGVRLPDSMEGLGGRDFGFKVPSTENISPVKIHDSTPWKTHIPKSGKKY